MKKWNILFIILLIIGLTFSYAEYTISEHKINIVVDSGGSAEIVEKFTINFENDVDKVIFRNQSTTMGSDFDKWKTFNPIFGPNIGVNNIMNGKISYTEGNPGILEISYRLTEKLMVLGKETSMMSEYQLKANYWNKFYQSGVWIIPDNTKVQIELPAGAEIREDIEPAAIVTAIGSKKVILWEGYKTGNKLTLKYVLWKKVTPVVDLNQIINFLFKTSTGLIFVTIIALIILTIIWKRKYITKNIEEFVEKNSKLEEE
ncbi:MAG: hypothetical protein GX950_03585 [Candidatus Diapherotrites archaeon]|jgi:hypothetical protein|uniref:DUF2207 domain-containing protein n=1 Tax=Candidatus Iainarchaeum sp. TaxID=3101447 RepID=A0A7K4C027_9ARCH|nr:hypothetical protein [Candidatus Diapherotrites archaeon]